jgi:hypothetical protein
VSSPAQTQATEHFEKDTEGFVLTVLHEAGEYRHLRFGKPGERWGSTDIHTWPHGVATSGDMADGWVFERGLGFFGGKGPNLSYWREKLARTVRGSESEFSGAALRATLAEQAEQYDVPEWCATAFAEALDELASEIEASHADITAAQTALAEFVFEYADDGHGDVDLRFSDTYEMDVEDYSFHFVWVCLVLNTVARWLDAGDERVIRTEPVAAVTP